MVSVYSVCSSVIFYNICLCIVFFLRRKTSFLSKHTTSILTIITFLGIFRLFTPVDLEAAIILPSKVIIPAIVDALRTDFLGGLSLGQLLLAVWALGTAAYITKDALKALQFARAARKFEYIKSPQMEKIAAEMGKYDVRVSPQVGIPYVSGIIKPVIYFPSIELSDEEVRYVLRHEIQHIKSRDGIKKLLFLCIEALFWWNPLAHISMREIDAILEIQCDANMTAAMSQDEVYKYMQSVISAMKQLSATGEQSKAFSSALLGKGEDIKQRFELMLQREKEGQKKKTIPLMCMFVVLFLSSYMFIIQPRSLPPEDEITNAVAILPEASYLSYENGVYVLYVEDEPVITFTQEEIKFPPLEKLEIRNKEE